MGSRGIALVVLVVLLVSFGPVGTRAGALAKLCANHALTSAADFQTIATDRDAAFGVGDITSMLRLPDGRLFFTLGDTGYYNVNRDGSAGPLVGFGNNSAWVQSGSCFTLLNRAGPGPRSWILPPQTDGSVYWPGASVVAGSRLYVFLARVFLNQPFGTPVGAAVATFDLPSLQLARITEIPFDPKRAYGAGAVYDNGYLYVYGSQQQSCDLCFAGDMYEARVPESQVNLMSAWQFRAGAQWVADKRAAKPVLSAAVSNVDVQPYGNGFLLLTKTYGLVAPDVEAWWAPNPEHPWQDLGRVYSVPDPPPSYVHGFTYQQAYTYNPVVLTTARLGDGGFLGSYNVNSFDPSEPARDGRMTGPRFVSMQLPPAPAAPPRPANHPGPSGWTPTFGVDRAGRVRTVNGVASLAQSHTSRAVGMVRTPSGKGGWVAAADGGVITFGDAGFYGSMGGTRLNQPIVGIGTTPTGHGYWLVARDGGIFGFGDARFYGSTGNIRLRKPVVAMASSPTGRGYWLVASDGGIFGFGDAHFYGSTGGAPPDWPVVGMAASPDGRGYWLVTLIGQVYSFGQAPFRGNVPFPLRGFVIGIVTAPGGYRLVDAVGNVFGRTAAQTYARIATSAPLVAAG